MLDILKGKPRSIIPVKSAATYDHIMEAISTNNIPDKHLRAAVTMCQTNPSSVIFVIYKSYENSILMLFGEKPYCIRLEGSKLENLMDRHSKEDYTYLFTYVK